MSKKCFKEVKIFEQLATEWNAGKYFTFFGSSHSLVCSKRCQKDALNKSKTLSNWQQNGIQQSISLVWKFILTGLFKKMSKRCFKQIKNFEQLATEWNAAQYLTLFWKFILTGLLIQDTSQVFTSVPFAGTPVC